MQSCRTSTATGTLSKHRMSDDRQQAILDGNLGHTQWKQAQGTPGHRTSNLPGSRKTKTRARTNTRPSTRTRKNVLHERRLCPLIHSAPHSSPYISSQPETFSLSSPCVSSWPASSYASRVSHSLCASQIPRVTQNWTTKEFENTS